MQTHPYIARDPILYHWVKVSINLNSPPWATSSKDMETISEVGSRQGLPCSSADAESTIIASVATFFPALLGQDVSAVGGSSFLLEDFKLKH